MSTPPSKSEGSVPLPREMRLEAVCVRFEAAWKLGGVPRIDDFLGAATGAERGPLLKELIRLDVSYRRQRGEAVSSAMYLQRFPELDPTWLAREMLSETLISAGPAQGSGETAPQIAPSRAALTAGSAPQVSGYEILGELGRGGMGVVYLAKNVKLDRLEVLKVVNQTLLDNPGVAERFLREMRLAAKLDHINVVKAHSAPEAGQALIFAMEYVDGEDLAKAVQRQGPLPIPDACNYVSQAAMGLQHAHEQRLVHRDIKPHNLIVARQGEKDIVKILDFGLSKARQEGEAATELTIEGAMMGTPAYMAPEQARDAADTDIRADIYSLGCTLYFLLTGAPPFTGKSAFEVMEAHVSREAAPVSRLRADAPPELAAVVAKMMAKDPARRFQTPSEAARALAPFIAVSSPAAVGPAAGGGATTAAWGGNWVPERAKKRWIAGAVVGATVLLAAGAVGLWAGGGFRWKAPGGNPVAVTTSGPALPPQAGPADPDAPPRAVAPFDAAQARRLQQAWADHLGVPSVREVFLADGVALGDGVRMKLALIPPGTFLMGSPASDPLTAADEKPQHRVTITKPFYIGMYPVTQEEYVRVTGLKNPSYFCSDGPGKESVKGLDTSKFPVEEVSWADATAFCEALNRKDAKRPPGSKYTLPTEAQWEHACRAGTTTMYFFGDDPGQLDDYGWYGENSGGRTHAVGTRKPNPWGLYDRGGNVYQWCLDGYGPYSSDAVTDPHDQGAADGRVLRGGSWHCTPKQCRSAFRWLAADGHYNNGGMRVCLLLD